MKGKTKLKRIFKWVMGIIVFGIVFAISFNQFELSTKGINDLNNSLSWILYSIVFVALILFVVKIIWKKTINDDERADFIGRKALGITYLAFIIEAFVIIIADGISPITTPYHLVMGYLIAISFIVYLISNKIISKFY